MKLPIDRLVIPDSASKDAIYHTLLSLGLVWDDAAYDDSNVVVTNVREARLITDEVATDADIIVTCHFCGNRARRVDAISLGWEPDFNRIKDDGSLEHVNESVCSGCASWRLILDEKSGKRVERKLMWADEKGGLS